jgi:hypothetical protein
LKTFITQFGPSLPLTPGPPVRLRDDQKGGTTIEIVIWRAFLPKTSYFSHPPRIYPPPYASGPPHPPATVCAVAVAGGCCCGSPPASRPTVVPGSTRSSRSSAVRCWCSGDPCIGRGAGPSQAPQELAPPTGSTTVQRSRGGEGRRGGGVRAAEDQRGH